MHLEAHRPICTVLTMAYLSILVAFSLASAQVRTISSCKMRQVVTVAAQEILIDNGSLQINGAIVTPPTCANSDATIDIQANGATPPYLYSIDNGITFQTSSTFTGLDAGTYNIVVQGASGWCRARCRGR